MTRARVLTGAAFGVATAVVVLGVLGSLVGLTGATVYGGGVLLAPVLCALPAALVGVLAGPSLERAEGPGRAVAVGVVAAVVAVAALVGASLAVMLVGDLRGTRPNLALLDWEDLPLIAVATLAAGAAFSPIGGLVGYAVWRRLRPDRQPRPGGPQP